MEQAIGVVAIGRNEGERLKACLRSLAGGPPVVYVDSGSGDGSQDFARSLGVAVVELAVPPGFTAARARNAGLAALMAAHPETALVQFIDGDCVVEPGWLDAAAARLAADPGLVAVFGRRRERFPDATIYNRLADDEWNVAVGPALATGGDAMFRAGAVLAVGGYAEDLIAGEEPDLCLRLRAQGWRIERIDAAMTLHDAAMTRFGQWWARAKRAGWAFGEHVRRHGAAAIPDWTAQVKRTWLWGLAIPAAAAALIAAGLASWPLAIAGLAMLALYPLQTLRFWHRDRARFPNRLTGLKAAFFLAIVKLPQAAGLLRLRRDRRGTGSAGLIEYKG